MITEATLNQWVEKQVYWLDEFNMRLEVNKHKGVRQHKADEPYQHLYLTHNSGQYTTLRLITFGDWPETRLHNALIEMILMLLKNRRRWLNYTSRAHGLNLKYEKQLENYISL